MIALVLFLVMIALRQDVLVSIVVSVLAGLILAYYLNHLNISYTPSKEKDSKTVPAPAPSASSVPAPANSAPNTTTIQSSASNAALNANSSNFDFFKSFTN
jgi:hypothetical protein